MTTDIQYRFFLRTADCKEVVNLPRYGSQSLAVAIWSVRVVTTLAQARDECLEYAVNQTVQLLPVHELWLLACHETVQDDSRITRYNAFWNSLQRSGVPIPGGDCRSESIRFLKSGLRAFGAMRIAANELHAAAMVLERACGVFACLPAEIPAVTVQKLIDQGWSSGGSKPPAEIIDAISPLDGVALGVFGVFDDIEATVVAVGNQHIMQRFKASGIGSV